MVNRVLGVLHFAARQARREQSSDTTGDLAWAIKMIERAGDLSWTDADKDRYWAIKRRFRDAASKGN